MVENGGNASQAMIDAGYSPATAKTPSKLTSSKAYQTIVLPKLKRANVTLDQYIDNVGVAMNANVEASVTVSTKDKATGKVTHETKIVDTGKPDIHTRLAGNKQAEKLLKIDQLVGANDESATLEPEDLQALAGASDEIELTRILFKKNKA